MNKALRLVAAAAVLVVIGASPLVSAGSANATTGVPFTDPNAQGTLSLCDKSGHPVTSGKLTDVPFVWRVVSSTPAPKGYVSKLGKATLILFQPRQNVNPLEWSGKQFTSSSWYTNPSHPMAQATYGDPALIDLVSIAPLWQGTVQLRLIYSNVNTVAHTHPYPAAVIKVSGNSWTLMTPNSTPCNSGSATADETQYVPKQALPSASPTLRNPSGGTPSVETSQTDEANGPATSGGGGSDGNVAAGADQASSGASGIPLWVLVALIALPVGGVVAGFALARRSTATGGHSRP